jgi:hypothetical protein
MSRAGVRLTEEERAKLELIAIELDIPLSALLRMGAIALLAHIKKHNGKIVLPLDFEDLNRPKK